jgi:hypothetical protein
LKKGINVFKRDTKGKFVYRVVFDQNAADVARVRIQNEINELQENRTGLLKRSPRPAVKPVFFFIPIFLCCLILFVNFSIGDSTGRAITPILLW